MRYFIGIMVSAVGLFGCVALGGCAINDFGAGTFRHYANESVYAVEMSTLGVHLVTIPGDGGLTLGSSRRTLYFRRPTGHGGGSSLDAVRLVEDAEASPLVLVCDRCRVPMGELGEPIALRSRSIGVELSANSNRTGMSVGYRAADALMIPAEFDGIVYIRWAASTPAAACVAIQEESKP